MKGVSALGRHAALMLAATVAVAVPLASSRAQTLPADAKPSCAVSAATFGTWFQSGTPATNGVVNPANGINFPNAPNCSFYQWAAQMFLWLTSPAPSVYGGGDHIFDSPSFFDLSTPDASGNRTLLAHSAGFIHPLAVRVSKLGPNRLPIGFTRDGTPVQILPAQTITGSLRLPNAAGQLVEVTKVSRAADGTLQLMDARGASVQPRLRQVARPALGDVAAQPSAANLAINNELALAHTPNTLGEPIRVQKFILGGNPIFIDPFGNVVDVDQDQADGSVLMGGNHSLVYYTIMVNDVWAYFLTGVKDGVIQHGNAHPHFPISQTDLSAIEAFASAHGKTFPDPDALGVEVKSSWIEASSLPNASNYVTVQAEVPTYNTSNPQLWVQTGTHTTTLALVGMHVVGSVNGHPEMIWASFEHFGNAPNEAYSYLTASGNTNSVPRSTAGTWLFTAPNSNGPFDQPHMTGAGANIQATSGFTVSPSDTIRWKAFGAASDLSPNPLATPAASNSEVISVSASVLGMLKALTPGDDVRQNYYLLGATWTIGGEAPTPGVATAANPGNQVGTSRLESATLETYDQGNGSASTSGGLNCMFCHQANTAAPAQADVGVSFMFPVVKPLF